MVNILHENKDENTLVVPLSVEHTSKTNHTTVAIAALTPDNARIAIVSTNELENKGNILLTTEEMDKLCLAWMAYRAEQKAEEERIGQEIDAMLKKIRDHGFDIAEGPHDFGIVSVPYRINITCDPHADDLQSALDSALLEVEEQEAEKAAKILAQQYDIPVKQTSPFHHFNVWFPDRVEPVTDRLALLDAVKRAIDALPQQKEQ